MYMIKLYCVTSCIEPAESMGNGIGYPNDARRMKGQYGTGEDPYPLTSLIKTIYANHNYAYTRQCPLCALYRVMT